MIKVETLIEAQVVRISLDKANANAEVELLSADKRVHWRLVAEGVDEFLMEDLGLYNIVDDIFIYDADDVSDDDFVSKLYYLLKREEVSSDNISCRLLQERINLIRSGALQFWVVNPVYGGLMFVLAKKIFVCRGNDSQRSPDGAQRNPGHCSDN